MITFWRVYMAVLYTTGIFAFAEEAPTVLALGDSITGGGKTFVCYRQVLIPELRKKGAAFKFIGPIKDAASAHAGYGGRNTTYLLGISKDLYRKYPADILMLHSGHNSFSKDKPVPGIVRDTEAIIENVTEINANVTILLAQVIPAGKLPKYSYIPELNKELESLSARLSERGYNVVLVNHANGFDWNTDTISDKVHPNAAGAKKMADRWLDALLPLGRIKEVLAQADQPPRSVEIEATFVDVSELDVDALGFEWLATDERAKERDDSVSVTYDVITQKQTQKLKAIRDAYGSIPDLDALYEDRTHTNGLPYHLYVPQGLKRGEPYPLVTFLHGYSDLTIDTHKGFPKGVWSLPLIQSDHPHILFVPRYRTFDDMWVQDNYRAMVIETMSGIIKEFNSDQQLPGIDTDRLYLTGFSQGGMGTWDFVKHYQHTFAAAAPLSGFSFGPQNIEDAEALRHLPIWIFNGDGDKGVAGSRLSYAMLKKAGALDVRYHEYEKQGHVIDDFAYFTEGFMDWFFDQSLEARSSDGDANKKNQLSRE